MAEAEPELVEVLHARLGRPVSAGPMQTTRLSAPLRGAAFLGSGAEVLLLRTRAPGRPAFEPGTQGPSVSRPVPLDSVDVLAVGGLGSAAGFEVQAVHARALSGAECVVAAADASGRARVGVVRADAPPPRPASGGEEEGQAPKRARLERPCAAAGVVELPPAFPVEAGWCGVRLEPGARRAATAAQYGKRATVHAADGRAEASIGTPHGPTALAWMGSPSVLLVANSNLVGVWDPRAPRWAATLREGSDPIHCLATLDSRGLVAAAGVDKCVTVYDSRKWSKVAQRGNAMKFEVTALHFSEEQPDLCYVAALDHQVTSARWGSDGGHHNTSAPKLKREGYRGDSRWVGVGLVPGSGCDELVGVTAGGHLSVLRHPYRLGTRRGGGAWDAALHP